MKPISNQSKHPVGITRLAQITPNPYALFIMLDGEPHCEISEKTPKTYIKRFSKWADDVLPSLERSVVRYFVRGKFKKKQFEIIECNFKPTKTK